MTKEFNQLFQTVKTREYCFESSFPQTSNPPLISTIPGIIDVPGFRSKVLDPRYFSKPLFANLKLDLDSENPATTFGENEFDHKEKTQQVAL